MRYGGVSTSDFVELIGPAGTDLRGYTLMGMDNLGETRIDVVLEGVIASDGLWVGVFGESMMEEADAVLGPNGFAAPTGSVVLRDCFGNQRDALGYGEFGAEDVFLGEGAPANAAGADQSLGRCPLESDGIASLDTVDSANNANDFLADAASPGAPNDRLAGAEACQNCDPTRYEGLLWLGEILYDPQGADDQAIAFVEVRGEANLVLKGVTLERWDEPTSSWVYVGDMSAMVGDDGFLLVAEDDTLAGAQVLLAGVDGDNDAGGFRLVACDSVILDTMGYGALADDTLLELNGEPAADVADGRSLARCPDGATLADVGDFADAEPTPGALNGCE